MTSLARRTIAEEQMDAVDLDPATYDAVLRDLGRVNRVTMAARPTLAFLNRASRDAKRLRILDVGFGDGGMLRTVARWGEKHGVACTCVGIDLNPRSAATARALTPDALAIDYRTGDYAGLAGQQWDIVISSLVAHHMSHDQLVTFVRFMESESLRGWFVNDLHRHGFAYRGYPLLARIFGWHPIVRADGQLSIARSYRPREWPPILAQAGINDARVFRAFPFRLCVERIR